MFVVVEIIFIFRARGDAFIALMTCDPRNPDPPVIKIEDINLLIQNYN